MVLALVITAFARNGILSRPIRVTGPATLIAAATFPWSITTGALMHRAPRVASSSSRP